MQWEITQLLENGKKLHILEMECNMNVISLLCAFSFCTHTSRPYTLSLVACPLAACWWATLKSQSWQMTRNRQQNRTRGGNWWVAPRLKGHRWDMCLLMTDATKWLLLRIYSGYPSSALKLIGQIEFATLILQFINKEISHQFLMIKLNERRL